MINSEAKLIQYLKETLGEPIINVEITDNQFKNLINQAIKKVTYYIADGKVEGSILLDLEKGVNTYKLPDNTYSVENVSLGDKNNPLFFNIPKGYSINVTNPMDINYFSNSQLYSFDIQKMTEFLSKMSQIETLFKLEPNYTFNSFSKELHFFEDIDANKALIKASFEYIPNPDNDYIYDNIFVKELALAYAYKQWANNLGKYETQLVNGSSLNYRDIQSKGEDLENKVLEDLKRNIMPFGIDVY